MATIAQIEANRRNAQKSTGPRTPEGKAVSRMNALCHGLRARTVVLPGESQQEFDQLCDDLQAEWRPETRTEFFYLEQMAVSQWKLNRTEVAEKSIYEQVIDVRIQLPLLDRLWQSQTRFERSYARAQAELKRLLLQGGRPIAPQPQPDDPAPSPRNAPVLVRSAAANQPVNIDPPQPEPQPESAPQVAPADPEGVYR